MGASWFLANIANMTLALTLSATLVPGSHGVDVNSLKDMKCLKKPPTPVPVDMEWATKVGDWYISAASQLYLYRDSSEVLKKPIADIAPYELYYKGCLHFLWGERGSFISGFGGKRTDVDLKPDPSNGAGADGWFTFRMPYLGLEGNKAAVTLTDNSTFAVFYMCYPQSDEATWAVTATVPILPEEKMYQIWTYVKSLGFSDKQFARIRYETCEAFEW